MNEYLLAAFASLILSSLSQVLLKKSSNESKKNIIYEYVNSKVLTAYSITFICMLLMIYALKGIEYKYAAVIESLAYLIIMIFSGVFLKEKITWKKIIGNFVIVLGVIVFSMNGTFFS